MSGVLNVSKSGRSKAVPAVRICGVTVSLTGRWFKTGEIHDEFWLERNSLPCPDVLLSELKKIKDRPDVFTFSQRVPDTDPRYGYRYEVDNYAVLSTSTYEHWFQKQIPAATRRAIRASEKRGIVTRASEYDDNYVRGITSIYNETPIRAGRRFWHFGKEFETVERENGTYAERSTYLAAYSNDEMVGYLKLVWDRHTAAIMQIVSKLSFRESRPNNALLAEAVRQCCLRHVSYLLYEKFDYGRKTGDSLTRFKQNNGFVRMDVPRYYIPLTVRGYVALRVGLHKHPSEWLPECIAAPARHLRTKWYEKSRVGS